MADQEPDIVKDGNTFLLRFLIALVLVTYFIVPKPPEAQLKVNANVGEGERMIDVHRADIQERLRLVNRELRDLGVAGSSGPLPIRRVRVPVAVAAEEAKQSKRLEELLATRRELREKLIKLNGDYVGLEKARILRQLAIPGTSFSLIESDVRMLYPGALAIGMLLLLNYRRKLLASVEQQGPVRLPLWAAPIPFRSFRQSMRWTCCVNIAGLAFVGGILLIYRDFVLRDEFYPELRIAAIQLVLGCAVAVLYGLETVRAIGKSFRKPDAAGKAR